MHTPFENDDQSYLTDDTPYNLDGWMKEARNRKASHIVVGGTDVGTYIVRYVMPYEDVGRIEQLFCISGALVEVHEV